MSAVDLSTSYLGLSLSCPIVASAGPLTGQLDGLERLQAAGVGAVVLPSLFEEDIVAADRALHSLHIAGTDAFAEAASFLPWLPAAGPAERYLDLIKEARHRLDIPVIASLNGLTTGGWIHHAADAVAAGASAIELNVYLVAADPTDTGTTVEHRLVDLVRAVRATVDVPLAVKLSPYFSALGDVAEQVVGAGADGLVLFNRFSQPDIDLDEMEVVPGFELSTSADLRLPLRWTALLSGRLPCSIALSGGVHSAIDAVKAIAAGADVAMTTSALLRHGPDFAATLRSELERWLTDHEYESVAELRGSMSQTAAPNPDEYERAQYVRGVRRMTVRYG